MPPQAVDVVSATYAAWNAGDWALGHFHPELEWELLGRAALDQTAPGHGRDEFFAYLRRFWAAWKPGARWEVELKEAGPERVLAHGSLRLVGRTSGLETDVPFHHLWTVRDGVVVRFLGGDDPAPILKAAGR